MSQKKYRYRVEYIKRGIWVPVMQTDIEDAETFRSIANADERQYRILRDEVDVTAEYKK